VVKFKDFQGLSSTCPVFKYFQGLEFRRPKFKYFQGLSRMRGNPSWRHKTDARQASVERLHHTNHRIEKGEETPRVEKIDTVSVVK